MDLTLLMPGVLAFAILMYVLLDGFDLGVGMLSALVPDPAWRDRMVDSIAPVWDGNETWLILGGAILFFMVRVMFGFSFGSPGLDAIISSIGALIIVPTHYRKR